MAHSYIGKEDIMFTIRQASEITGLSYGRLWYGGVSGRYPRPELRLGHRLYYTKDQIHQIAEQIRNERVVEYRTKRKETTK
jgi:hypothetical protein